MGGWPGRKVVRSSGHRNEGSSSPFLVTPSNRGLRRTAKVNLTQRYGNTTIYQCECGLMTFLSMGNESQSDVKASFCQISVVMKIREFPNLTVSVLCNRAWSTSARVLRLKPLLSKSGCAAERVI